MARTPLPNDNDEICKIAKQRCNIDTKELIDTILMSPLKSKGDVVIPDGKMSLEALSKMNVDVQTRIIMQIAKGACSPGGVKEAEFLMKYSGREPVREQNITVDMPQLIDDMSCRASPVVAAALASNDDDDDEEDDEDISKP